MLLRLSDHSTNKRSLSRLRFLALHQWKVFTIEILRYTQAFTFILVGAVRQLKDVANKCGKQAQWSSHWQRMIGERSGVGVFGNS